MYVNYVNDRKQLGYQALKDTVPNFSYIFVYPSRIKGKAKKIIVVIVIGVTVWFTPLKPVDAKDNGFLPGAEAWSNKPSISRPLRRNY